MKPHDSKQVTSHDRTAVVAFIRNTQSTHKADVENPIWVCLLKLRKRYLSVLTQHKEKLTSLGAHILKHYPDDQELIEAHAYLKHTLEVKPSLLNAQRDKVPNHLMTQYNVFSMPLRHVFAVVYAALTDSAYCFETSTEEQRLATLCNTIKSLYTKQVCHTGIRNNLFAPLIGVYQSFDEPTKPIMLIQDFNSAVLDWFKQEAQLQLEERSLKKPKLFHKEMFTWIEDNQMPQAIQDALVREKKNICDTISEKLERNGIPRETFQKKIEQYLNKNYLKHLDIPLTPDNPYYWVKELLEQPEKTGDIDRDTALQKLTHQIKKGFPVSLTALNSNSKQNLISQLRLFLKVDKAFLLAKMHGHALETQAADVKSTINCCVNFYRFWPGEKPHQTSRKRIIGELKLESKAYHVIDAFNTAAHQYLKENRIIWIENFFSAFHASVPLRTEQATLYIILRNLNEQEKIKTPDRWLRHIKQQYTDAETQSLNIGPYEANRIVLHALLTPPNKWTPLFSDILSALLIQLKGQNFEHNLTRQFRDDSYPEQFITQLDFLKAVSETPLGSQNPPLFPETPFPIPMPDFIRTYRELQWLLHCTSPEKRILLLEQIGDIKRRDVINNANQLEWVVRSLPQDQKIPLMGMLNSEHIKAIINNSEAFGHLVKCFEGPQLRSFFKSLGSETLKDIIIHAGGMAAITTHPTPLRHFTPSMKCLIEELDPQHIRDITSNVGELSSILGNLISPPLSYYYLDKFGIINIKPMIRNYDQLDPILNALSNTSCIDLLQELGVEKISGILKTNAHLTSILLKMRTCADTDSKNIMRNMATQLISRLQDENKLEALIDTSEKFISILKSLYSSSISPLLIINSLSDKHIQTIIKTPLDVTSAIEWLYPCHYDVFLNKQGGYLGITTVETKPSVSERKQQVSTDTVNVYCLGLLKLLRQKANIGHNRKIELYRGDNIWIQPKDISLSDDQYYCINALLSPGNIKKIIIDIDTLVTAINTLARLHCKHTPYPQRSPITIKMINNIDKNHIKKIIKNTDDFIRLIPEATFEQLQSLINKIDPQYLKEKIIPNWKQLDKVIATLDPKGLGSDFARNTVSTFKIASLFGREIFEIDSDRLVYLLRYIKDRKEQHDIFYIRLGVDKIKALIYNCGVLDDVICELSDPALHLSLIKDLGDTALAQIFRSSTDEQITSLITSLSMLYFNHQFKSNNSEDFRKLLPLYYFKDHIVDCLDRSYPLKIGRVRGHCSRMHHLKQNIQEAKFLSDIRVLLKSEMEAYAEQSQGHHSLGSFQKGAKPKESKIKAGKTWGADKTRFRLFKPSSLKAEPEDSRYYSAILKALELVGGTDDLPSYYLDADDRPDITQHPQEADDDGPDTTQHPYP